MNRLVYLFELDTAKTSKTDAEIAEYAIFNEIIKNGNKVVLSMNQFVDSRLMTSAVYDEDSFKYVRRLFDEGSLKVALFADVCSVSQYVQSAIEKCLSKPREGYVFNTLPVKADDEEMLLEVKNALRYSDLTNLNKRLDGEYVKLRYEMNYEAKSDILDNIRRLRVILRFLSLVLKLSVSARGNNPAKTTEDLSFIEFIDAAREVLRTESFRRRDINACKEKVLERLDGALTCFEEEGLTDKQINRRTTWLRYLNSSFRNDTVNELCVEIVNICYNYAVQDTIAGVSKQYDDYDFDYTFKFDFVRRVNLTWALRGRRALANSRVEDAEYRLFYPKQWKRAAAISGYNSDYHTIETVTPDDNPEERKNWYMLILKKFGVTLGFAAAYVGAFCLIGFILDIINGALETPTAGLIFSNLGGVVLVIVASVILSTFTKLPNAFECAIGVVRHVGNIYSATVKNYDLREKK